MKELLKKRLNCSQRELDMLCEDLEKLSPALRPALDAWLADEKDEQEPKVLGYSLSGLKADFGMNFTGALLTLDWLIKDPEAAQKALRYGIR